MQVLINGDSSRRTLLIRDSQGLPGQQGVSEIHNKVSDWFLSAMLALLFALQGESTWNGGSGELGYS